MIRCFYIEANKLHWEKTTNISELIEQKKIIWLDLQSPSEEEQKTVEDIFKIEFFTQLEAAEIESSSRYLEDFKTIEANSGFVVHEGASYDTKQVSFILKDDILFTLRMGDIKSFASTVRKLKIIEPELVNGFNLWLLLLESQIDFDADFIEYISRSTNLASKKLTQKKSLAEEILLQITNLQENTILIRESIVDKQRLVSSLLKSRVVSELDKERIRIIIKDINSLLQHTQFSFERLEYLQNTFLGLLNIEQNQVIKIFTVVTVIFMPPTLIASVYGMNFDFMPELGWRLGYPFAILLMILSSIFFLWYFKRKKWL